MPTVSAYAHLSGPFDYNKMPLAPMGCEVQIHEKTDSRGTWAYHSVDGWYLNTSAEHYRVHNCHVKHTKSERLTDTFQFKHHAMPVPTITATDRIIAATRALTAAIEGTQELPPSKLQAIKNPRLLLLGEKPLQPVPIDPPLPTHP